ncbi:XVIPCD domain-containing protein [Dyella psychrodurans]|uniref:X-Tfes XVIPCD domain-containing protein n=1 Tax=Dyella psychrodurans TaxID=1927960 RepID=A0A370X540_9GAMM|nr:XVIPCD domain-containing protein [Dyella psychrodurans]RDS83380.1 hypothetical protein DWU99_12660 [Dyella psychrodurans]
MTLTAKEYALLCKDSYNEHTDQQKLVMGDASYTVLDHYSDPITGYQGVAYQREDTHEVVVVHRGTELSFLDIATDVGMVTEGINVQIPHAIRFSQRVTEKAEADAASKSYALPPITTAGHSLGGTLTELVAHKMHWQGVTFNSYGAVDLGYDIPQGGTQVINYVRVTDMVSAASHHFGKVVELATQDDVDALRKAGYVDAATPDTLRNPWAALSRGAHAIANFAPDNPSLKPSDLSPENEARAHAHLQAIHLLREDVQALRANTLSLPWELQHKEVTTAKLAMGAVSAVMDGDFNKTRHITTLAEHRALANTGHALDTTTHTAWLSISAIDQAGAYVADQIKDAAREVNHGLDHVGRAMGSEALEHGAQWVARDLSHGTDQIKGVVMSHVSQSMSAIPDMARPPISHSSTLPQRLDDPTHPDHAMYLQAREGVHKLDAACGRIPDQRSDQLAAALVVAARRVGLTQIEEVVLHRDAETIAARQPTPTSADWTKEFLRPTHADVPTVPSLNTPIEQSSQQWGHVMQQKQIEQAQAHERQLSQQQETLKQASHGFTR